MSMIIWSRYHKDAPTLTLTHAAYLIRQFGTPETAAFRRASRQFERAQTQVKLAECCELAPHIPEDSMDRVSGRSLPESSTAEMAVVGRRRPCTVPRSGINRLVYI
jgi:hypothetical protein